MCPVAITVSLTDKSILTAIDKAVSSSIELRSKKELIEGSFRDGTLKTTGTDLDKILPPFHGFPAVVEQSKNRPSLTDSWRFSRSILDWYSILKT